MTSEENISQNVEESIFQKCGRYCSRGTTKANYYALNKAVNIFLITFLLIIIGIIGSLTWIFILAFTGVRTPEMSYMIVLFVLQLFVAAIHGFLLKRKTQIFCMICIVLDVAITIFLIILIIVVVVKNGVVINPQARTLPITIALTLIYVFAFLGDFNLIRFLHAYPKHWIGTKIIGQHSLQFSATKVQEDKNDDDGNYFAGSVIDDYDLIEIKSADNLSSNQDDETLSTLPNLSRTKAVGNGDRQQSGMDSFDEEEETYPKEMNPFSGEIEVIPQVPMKDDSTQTFSNEKIDSSLASDDEPQSEYLIDVPHKLPQYHPPPPALPKQEMPKRIPRRSRNNHPMQYMAHFHDWKNPNRIMLPDGTFVVQCPWDPHQLSTNETSPRILHPNSSVIIEKSPVPVPAYLERADFISLLPNTKV